MQDIRYATPKGVMTYTLRTAVLSVHAGLHEITRVHLEHTEALPPHSFYS